MARRPHNEGVKKGEKEPALTGIFGEGPVDLRLSEPSTPVRDLVRSGLAEGVCSSRSRKERAEASFCFK